MKTKRSIRATYLPFGLIASMTVMLLFSAGCNSAEMTNYFAAADLDEKEAKLKFYRVTVKGESRMSRTNLQTGFYDASALHSLFGMVSAEDKNKNPNTLKKPASVMLEIDPITGQVKRVEQDQRFAVLYGSNADALASQISAFSQSETTGQAMARIIGAAAGQDAYTGLISAKADAEQAQKANQAANEALTATVSEIEDDDNGITAKRKLVKGVIKALQDAGVVFEAPAITDTTTDPQLNEAIKILNGVLDGLKNGGGA